MIEAVKKGDKVITAGGVHAVVYTVKEKTVILKVDENTKMEFSKSAISSVVVDKVEEKADPKVADKADAKVLPETASEKPAEEKK
jgi:preprotein translocase subunit YajC